MKKLFSILIVMVLAFSLTAQISAGSMFIGTNSDFTYSTLTDEDGDDASSILLINGQFGYFFTENICGGVSLSHASKTLFSDESVTGYGLFGRYYSNALFYCHLGYNMGEYSLYGPVFPIEDYSGIDLGIGYCVWLGDNITLEPSLLYTLMSQDGEREANKLDIQVGFGIYF